MSESASKPKFVYVTYIASTAEKVFEGHPEYESLRHERPSRVLFELEQLKGQVKLTVTHDDFDADSKVFESISGGWPLVLSSLKSMLETGKALEPTFSEEDMRKIEAACAQ